MLKNDDRKSNLYQKVIQPWHEDTTAAHLAQKKLLNLITKFVATLFSVYVKRPRAAIMRICYSHNDGCGKMNVVTAHLVLEIGLWLVSRQKMIIIRAQTGKSSVEDTWHRGLCKSAAVENWGGNSIFDRIIRLFKKVELSEISNYIRISCLSQKINQLL